MILMERWRCPIVSGRCASKGRIVERAEDVIAVRLFNMTVNASKREADAFLMLVGHVLPDAYVGRDVQIGCSYDGLQVNTAQSLQVAYRVDGNQSTCLFDEFVPFAFGTMNDLRIAEVQSDGSQLS